jgi:hypothetical protein
MVRADHVLQPRLFDRRDPLIDPLDVSRILIDPDDLVSLAGKDGGERSTELPQADDSNAHD